MGTYCHGLLASAGVRGAVLAWIGAQSDGRDHAAGVDAALDEIADALERHLDIEGLIALGREGAA